MSASESVVSLAVEGWRGLSHSYALVAQWHCLSLLKRRDIQLCFTDRPFYGRHWQTTRGVFGADEESRLARIPPPSGDRDATLRIAFPFDATPASSGRTFVFATSESGVAPGHFVPAATPETIAAAGITLVTPSRWSRRGFELWGVATEAIAVVPHGVDTRRFRPDRRGRDELRKRLRLDGIVVLSVGAMTPNKGMDVLLGAFAAVARRHRRVTLLLKGNDALYGSGSLLQSALNTVSRDDRAALQGRVVYVGAVGTTEEIAQFYQAADVYVAPYRSEGFCLPVLEAMSSGLPVICTAGGPTDDFTAPDCAVTVAAETVVADNGLYALEPDRAALIQALDRAIEDAAWRQSAGAAGRRRAVAAASWDVVTERLVSVLRSGVSAA